MRAILGSSTSSFDLGDVMNQSGILIANLAKGLLGEINMMWLGMILLSKLQTGAMKRTTLPAHRRPTFYLYVDEFQSFAATSFETMLSEARKFGLALTLANQHVGQLPERFGGALWQCAEPRRISPRRARRFAPDRPTGRRLFPRGTDPHAELSRRLPAGCRWSGARRLRRAHDA